MSMVRKFVIAASLSVTMVASFDSVSVGEADPDFGVKVQHARCTASFQVLPPDREYTKAATNAAVLVTTGAASAQVASSSHQDSDGDESTYTFAIPSGSVADDTGAENLRKGGGFSNPICWSTNAPKASGVTSVSCRPGTDADHTVEVYGREKVRCVSRLIVPSLPAGISNPASGDAWSFDAAGKGFQDNNAWSEQDMDDVFCMEERNPSQWDDVMKAPRSVPYVVRITHDVNSLGSVGDSDGQFYIYKISGSNKFVVKDVVFTRCTIEHYQGCCGLANMTTQLDTADFGDTGFVHKWGGWNLVSTNKL